MIMVYNMQDIKQQIKTKLPRIVEDFVIIKPGDQDCLHKIKYKLPQLKIICGPNVINLIIFLGL